jgi:3-hydroxyisobutyrate dehydrogenase-like beta-hydroxyacid dehydrogenase
VNILNQKIALFGLGIMSAGMASNLLRAGFSLTVYKRTAAKAQPLISADARLAPAVTGSRVQPGAGQLCFPVGGNEGSLQAATPALQAFNASYQGNEQRSRR